MRNKTINVFMMAIMSVWMYGCSDNSGELVSKSDTDSSSQSSGAVASGSDLPEGHPPIGSNQGMPPSDSMLPDPQNDAAQLDGNTLVIGPVTFEVGENWQSETPSSSFRAAQFRIDPVEGDSEPAELAVFQGIGGSNQQNIDRWIGQFQDATAENYKVDQKQHGPFDIMLLDITGTYNASMGPMMGGGQVSPGSRMLAASVEGPGGPWHFKLVGPAATVAASEDEFNALIDSLSTSQ